MRQPVPLAPIPHNRWEGAGARGIERLTLNHDPDTGALTALVRSAPRDGFERRGQYHHCEEEFLCLAGHFTFDGLHWMRPWSYTCYPAHVVHGARVSVPGGYLLYLRTSGPSQAHSVDEPVMDEAYHSPDAPRLEPIVVLEHTFEPHSADPLSRPAPTRILRRVLRTRPEGDAEVSLWAFGGDNRDIFQHFQAATPLEVLIVRAGPEAADGVDSLLLAYGCYGPSDARPIMDAEGPVVALVHAGRWA